MIIALAAVYNGDILGDSAGMCWHCPEDLRRFRARTMGKVVIAGYRTAQTLPALPGRFLEVWQRGETPRDMLRRVQVGYPTRAIAVIGGRETYRAFAPWVDEFWVDHIEKKFLMREPDVRSLVLFPEEELRRDFSQVSTRSDGRTFTRWVNTNKAVV